MEPDQTQTQQNPEPQSKKPTEKREGFAPGIEGLFQALKGGGKIISMELPDGTVIMMDDEPKK